MTTMMAEARVPVSCSQVEILGIAVHNIDMEQTLCAIDGFAQTGRTHHIITADASMLVMAQKDPELRGIVARAELVTPDSIGILWAAKRRGSPLRERVSGVEIVEQLCARSAETGLTLYFLGAAPTVAATAAERMRSLYPGAQVVGTRDGFFTEAETDLIVAEIRRSAPDVLCVALGIPKQEKWIEANRERLGVPVLIGVGGTLDVLSGNVRRAPVWMRRLHAEWLWRVVNNPRKINKVLLLPRFVLMVRRAGR